MMIAGGGGGGFTRKPPPLEDDRKTGAYVRARRCAFRQLSPIAIRDSSNGGDSYRRPGMAINTIDIIDAIIADSSGRVSMVIR